MPKSKTWSARTGRLAGSGWPGKLHPTTMTDVKNMSAYAAPGDRTPRVSTQPPDLSNASPAMVASPCVCFSLDRARPGRLHRDLFRTIHDESRNGPEHKLGNDEPGPVDTSLQDRIGDPHQAVAHGRPDHREQDAAPRQ